ncbi:MAG: hypothetical protein QUT30_19935 [Acidobacteriota bacterium]|nr:hypothetical protein [Acidobacteriota bacterium]
MIPDSVSSEIMLGLRKFPQCVVADFFLILALDCFAPILPRLASTTGVVSPKWLHTEVSAGKSGTTNASQIAHPKREAMKLYICLRLGRQKEKEMGSIFRPFRALAYVLSYRGFAALTPGYLSFGLSGRHFGFWRYGPLHYND